MKPDPSDWLAVLVLVLCSLLGFCLGWAFALVQHLETLMHVVVH